MQLHQLYSAYPIVESWGDTDLFTYIEEKTNEDTAYGIFYQDEDIPKHLELDIENTVAYMSEALYQEFKESVYA